MVFMVATPSRMDQEPSFFGSTARAKPGETVNL
jgi:hypothetical protein